MADIEETLVFLKPDAYCRKYIGAKILQEFLNNPNFDIIAFKEVQVTEEHAKEHYYELEGKSFYPGLLKFITSANVLAMIIKGDGAIQKVRDFLGATLVEKADKSCIRGKYGIYAGINLVHASDGLDTAKRELALWKKKVGLIPSLTAKNDAISYVNKWISNELNETENLRKLCVELESNPGNQKEIESKLMNTLKKECPETEENKIKDLCSCVIENILSQD